MFPGGEYSGCPGSRSRNITPEDSEGRDRYSLVSNRLSVDLPAPFGPHINITLGSWLFVSTISAINDCHSNTIDTGVNGRFWRSSHDSLSYFSLS